MENIKVTYSVYKYDPVQSRFWVNGKLYAKEWTQLAHDLGYLVATGHEKEAIDMIKRDIRKKRAEKRRCTFGFFEKGSRRYFYTQQLTANDDDLQGKLSVYKEWKRYCESQNCVMAVHEVTEGSFIPGQKSDAKSHMVEEIADLSRPVKIYLVDAA